MLDRCVGAHLYVVLAGRKTGQLFGRRTCTWSGDEELQLKRITECWEKKAGNSELTSLHDFIFLLPKEGTLIFTKIFIAVSCFIESII